MSVRLFVRMHQRGSHWKHFCEILYRDFHENLLTNNFFLNRTTLSDTLHEDLSIFVLLTAVPFFMQFNK